MTSIIWNHKIYYKSSFIPDFFGFVAWLVGKESFTLVIGERAFKVIISHDGRHWNARTKDHDGSNLESHHAETRQLALEGLTAKLSEAIYEEKI